MPKAAPKSLEVVPEKLTFDGERFVGGAGVEITYDHWLRYSFAAQFAQGRRVLDVASGEGYGAAHLAARAHSVDGFDLEERAVAHAREKYRDVANLTYHRSDAGAFLEKAAPGSYDLVTCFEFIEHVPEAEQHRALAGIRRVLAPGGLAVISTPDKQLYSDVTASKNAFHVRELYRDEFIALLREKFPHVRILDQALFTGSALFESGATSATLSQMVWTDLIKLQGSCRRGMQGNGKYLVAVVSAEPLDDLPLESAVLVDLSRKLIGEELYSKHLEVERLKRVEAVFDSTQQKLEASEQELSRTRAELQEVRSSLAQHEGIVDRVLALLAQTSAEAAQAQRLKTEHILLKQELQHLRGAHGHEAERRRFLEHMITVKLALRAKALLDRTPLVKRVMKAVVKPLV
jgi:protein-L-isoaspartate O-methyltransferase